MTEDFEPRLDNWRLIRCLGSITHWGQQPEGFSDHRAPTPLSRGNGWVARRSAMCILFDYEAPFIDLMVEEGLLDHSAVDRRLTGVMPEAIRTTAKGEAHLSDWATAHAGHPTLGALARNILEDVLAAKVAA